MDAEQIKALIEAIKNQDGAAALAIAEAMLITAASGEEASSDASAADPLESAADPAADADEEAPAVAATLTARITKLEAERAESVKKLSVRVAELEAEKASAEKAERVTLVSELVKLGYEIPALAWEGEPEKMQPAKRLVAEPIAELRARVKTLSAAGPRVASVTAPASGGGDGEDGLSQIELSQANKIKDPAHRARFLEMRQARKVKSNG